MTTRADAVGLPTDSDEIIVGEGVALAVPPAGFLLRALGSIIDVALIALGYLLSLWLLGMILVAWIHDTGVMIEDAWIPVFMIIWAVFWGLVVPVTIETLSHGRSLGKLAVGIRVVRLDGGSINFRHAFVRGLTGLVEIFMTFGSVAALTGVLSPRGQRVGDLLAGTYAQLERLPRPQPLVLMLPPGLENWAAIADVSRLPDRIVRRIREFFLQADKLTPEARGALAADLARQAKPYVHPVPDVGAEVFLVAITVVRRERERRALEARARRIARLTPTLEQLPYQLPNR